MNDANFPDEGMGALRIYILLKPFLLAAKIVEERFVLLIIIVLRLISLQQTQEKSSFRRSKTHAPRTLLISPEDIPIR